MGEPRRDPRRLFQSSLFAAHRDPEFDDFMSFGEGLTRRIDPATAIRGPQQSSMNRDGAFALARAADLYFTGSPPSTELQLSFAITKLLDCDFSSEDLLVIVYAKARDHKLKEVGRTGVFVKKVGIISTSPEWTQKVEVKYDFEVVQQLLFHAFDVKAEYHNANSEKGNLHGLEFLGEACLVLSAVMTNDCHETLNLLNKSGHGDMRNIGRLTVSVKESMQSVANIKLRSVCESWSQSGPFLRISISLPIGDYVPNFYTELANNHLEITWESLLMSMQQHGSKENPLVIESFRLDSRGHHILIGKFESSLADLKKLYKEKSGVIFIIPPSHFGYAEVKKFQLFVDQFSENAQFSFLDYISSGFGNNAQRKLGSRDREIGSCSSDVRGGAHQRSTNRDGDYTGFFLSRGVGPPSSQIQRGRLMSGAEVPDGTDEVEMPHKFGQRSMRWNIDLRYAVPPLINITLSIFNFIGNSTKSSVYVVGIDDSQTDLMSVAVAFFGGLALLLFLVTSFKIPLDLQPIRLRAGDFSGSLCVVLLASMFSPPHVFWIVFLIAPILSPWYQPLKRLVTYCYYKLQRIPTLLITRAPKDQFLGADSTDNKEEFSGTQVEGSLLSSFDQGASGRRPPSLRRNVPVIECL